MAAVLSFHEVTVVRDGRPILDGLNWIVDESERWAVLGPNGAGKSTVLNLAAAQLHPTRGTVDILGERLGRSDVFELRPRIGYSSSGMANRIPAGESVFNAVMTAAYGVTGRWREQYEQLDEDRAREVLTEWRLAELADRAFGTLSDGERKRVQIARAVMADPELLLLDEPGASLDLGAREHLVAAVTAYATASGAPAIVLVTHHVEEIPAAVSHVLLLREGRPVAQGPVAEVLTDEQLSETFGMPLRITSSGGRFTARSA